MNRSVTVNDIANALNLSRNTVSKALNGKYVPPKTKRLVLEKAVELGYKNYDSLAATAEGVRRKILILSSKSLICANYYVYLIRGIEAEAERNHIEVLQYIFRPSSDFLSLKEYIKQFEVDGIICIEFFDEKSIEEILSLKIPILFIDFAYRYLGSDNYDVLLMENFEAVKEVCSGLIRHGAERFSFVGNPHHCKSFYERCLGMRDALYEHGLTFDPALSILRDSSFRYGDSDALGEVIAKYRTLPDCFVCANDFTALALVKALQQLGLADFKRIQILGFDNIPESRLSAPKLSTIDINKGNLGKQAVKTLLERIEFPQQNSRLVYLKCKFVNRETTQKW